MSGELDKAKGRIKQAAGDLTNDKDLEREGKVDEVAGKAKAVAGKAKERLDDAIDRAREGVQEKG